MGAFRVLHIVKVKEPLGLPVQLSHRVQFLFAHLPVFHRLGQRILQGRQPVADFRLPSGDLRLNLAHPGSDCFTAAVAFRALVQDGLAAQRAHQVMVMVFNSALGSLHWHMAVRAAQNRSMLALDPGFQLRMLGFEHLRARAGLLPVGEPDPVIVGQDRFRCHFLHAVVRHHRLAVRGGEVVFDVALSAGERSGVDRRCVLAQCLVHILVGHDHLAVVPVVRAVAGIAGDRVGRLCHDFFKRHRIDAHALLGDHLVHVRGLAGQAVGLRVGPFGLLHVVEGIGMAPGAAVILRETVTLIDIDQVRVLLQVVRHIVVLRLVIHRVHDGLQDFALGLSAAFGALGSFVRERALVLVFQLFPAAEHAGNRQRNRRDQHNANRDAEPLSLLEIIHVLASLVKRGSW